jgi:DNA-binding transcriptional LysR family regulator
VEINQKFRELDGPPAHFFASTSLAACRSLAINAVGISTLPNIMITKELEEAKLRKIRSVWTPSDLTFTASYSDEPFNPIAEVATNIAVIAAQEYNRQQHINNII